MKIFIVCGSHRPESQTVKVGRYIQHVLDTAFEGTSTHLLHLGQMPFPLWDEEMWEKGGGKWGPLWGPTSTELAPSDGIVVISPEWSGMVPAGLKNFFLLCGKHELAHKPGLIVTVSASRGGAYPVAELRMSSYKNTHLCYIPEHVIVRDVKTMLNDHDSTASPEDEYIRGRIHYALSVLLVYAKALRLVRESGVVDFAKYPFGM